MKACIEGRLQDIEVEMHNRSCAVVVIAAGGYPGKYPQGDEINMHDRHSQIGTASAALNNPIPVTDKKSEPAGQLNFFHAGTALREDGKLVTSRGRVIAVSATANSLENAVKLAYQGVTTVKFDGMFYRRDIAHRSVLGVSSSR
jgi:phosphoribosylamine--glycine ligase/phosphoribosylformylglycinamidine cyclo-ligase